MNQGSTATKPVPPKPPATGATPATGDKAAPTKVSVADPIGAVAKRGDKETRYIIGRKLAGDAKGNSAFAIAEDYKPDLAKLPESGTATLTLDATGRVTAIGIVATI